MEFANNKMSLEDETFRKLIQVPFEQMYLLIREEEKKLGIVSAMNSF